MIEASSGVSLANFFFCEGIIEFSNASHLFSPDSDSHLAIQVSTIVLDLLVQLIKIIVASKRKFLDDLTLLIDDHT